MTIKRMQMDRQTYVDMFGPTVGDKVRLGIPNCLSAPKRITRSTGMK